MCKQNTSDMLCWTHCFMTHCFDIICDIILIHYSLLITLFTTYYYQQEYCNVFFCLQWSHWQLLGKKYLYQWSHTLTLKELTIKIVIEMNLANFPIVTYPSIFPASLWSLHPPALTQIKLSQYLISTYTVIVSWGILHLAKHLTTAKL